VLGSARCHLRPGGETTSSRLSAWSQHLLRHGRANYNTRARSRTSADPSQHLLSWRREEPALGRHDRAGPCSALSTAGKLPVGHVGETAEIAEAYLYLMRQTYGTGQVVVADGGAALV
jgi:hypothetical protein